MNPPVEAPTSRHRRPAGSNSKAASAFASFWPPRETNRGPSATSTLTSSATIWPGLSAGTALVSEPHVAGQDGGRCPGAGLEQAALGQHGVEPLA